MLSSRPFPGPGILRDPTIISYRDGLEYIVQTAKHAKLIGSWQEYEDCLRLQAPQILRGTCKPCGEARDFKVSYRSNGWMQLRESLVCPVCGLNCRLRALIHLFLDEIPSGSRIYLTEQVTPLYRWLAERRSNLVGSEFLSANTSPGETNSEGLRLEDLTRLSFESDSFDFVMSFECLEHIPNYRAVLDECFRVLKPGGRLILSAPFFPPLPTLVRASVNPDGTVTHHTKPEYHGDPVNEQGILCYYHFGPDLLDRLRDCGFEDVNAISYYSRKYAYLQVRNQVYIVAAKPRSGQTA